MLEWEPQSRAELIVGLILWVLAMGLGLALGLLCAWPAGPI